MSNSAPADPVERIVQLYGDLLFDLCESMIGQPGATQLAFRSILKDVRAARARGYSRHERPWALRIAVVLLRRAATEYAVPLTASEQIELDAEPSISTRLTRFERYFRRLDVDSQLLLLLRDKYGIPYPEIASAMDAPEGSLKLRRSQALRTLEEWLWSDAE
jgi:DNA-directed RNA polymerase specialized sigma24 family protein